VIDVEPGAVIVGSAMGEHLPHAPEQELVEVSLEAGDSTHG